jgi:hypothetical protein
MQINEVTRSKEIEKENLKNIEERIQKETQEQKKAD